MPIRRSIPLCIVLCIVTCGIYGLYWFITLTNETNSMADPAGTSGGMAVLFYLITCGIYGYFWAYKMGTKVNLIKERCGFAGEDYNSILYLILSLFGLQIVVYALVQDAINQGLPNV